MIVMVKFIEHTFYEQKNKQQPSRGQAYSTCNSMSSFIAHDTCFDGRNSWKLVWTWFLGNSQSLVFLSFATLLKRIFSELEKNSVQKTETSNEPLLA